MPKTRRLLIWDKRVFQLKNNWSKQRNPQTFNNKRGTNAMGIISFTKVVMKIQHLIESSKHRLIIYIMRAMQSGSKKEKKHNQVKQKYKFYSWEECNDNNG